MIRRSVFLNTVVAASVVAGAAFAEDYPQHASQKTQSLSVGLAKTTSPLLARNQGSLASAKAALLSSFCGSSCQTSETVVSSRTDINASDWTLEIEGDGTAALYQVRNAAALADKAALPSASRMSRDALESAGRAFIASKLGKVVVLGASEQLVALTAAYRIEGGQDRQTKIMAAETVVANRVVFGRVINGIPIVGGGSTIAVTFANDGSVESFRYDWPTYTVASTSRSALLPSQIVARVQTVVAARSPLQAAPVASPVSTSAYPVALSSTAQLLDLDCGYFDPGVRNRDVNAPIQAGCTYHVVETLSDGMRAAHGGAVPAASRIEPDALWPEVAVLTGAHTSPVVPTTAP